MLESDRRLYALADTVVAEGCPEVFVESLVKQVANKLGATPENCHEHMVQVLKEKAKKEVAA